MLGYEIVTIWLLYMWGSRVMILLARIERLLRMPALEENTDA
jgi:hypothetical protein